MFLKKIVIQGFKSFADKTEIEFRGGITGVVGPNGSGKSNISDSIKWVLGEQSVKSLRGSKMEDVIFSGTEKRKPLGFAEVTLVLDNSEKDLPIDYSEVSVTRRVFRTGESEYYINKTASRLKDIRELFMDTGVGKDGYSIIGQGKIDEILSSKSEDRRNIFEEAAGIVKYKTRKEEAERKLKKTEDNLVRVNDIVEELRKQLVPLKTQSEKAVEYQTLRESLKGLEVSLYVCEIKKVREELLLLESRKKEKAQELSESLKDKAHRDEEYEKGIKDKDDLDTIISLQKDDLIDIRSEREEKESQIRLIEEKLSFCKRETTRLNKERRELLEESEILKKEKLQKEEEEKALSSELMNFKSDLKKKEDALLKLRDSVRLRETQIDEKKSLVLENFNAIADKKIELSSLSSFSENIEKRLVQLRDELKLLKNKRYEKSEYKKSLDEELRDAQSKLRDQEEKLLILSKDREKVRTDLREITEGLSIISREIHGKVSKHRVLNDMLNEYEGYYKGVKNALKASESNETLRIGVRGVLAELIDVPKIYEKAVEVALGSAIQNIVTNTQEDARDMINHLKTHNLGRATFLPIDSVRKRVLSENETRVLKQSKICGIASNLLDYDSDYKDIIANLLGRVVFVEKIEDGIEVSRKLSHSIKIVSLDGDLLNPGGSMTGGSLQNNNTKLLGRGREINELDSEIVFLRKTENEKIRKKKECESRLKKIEADEQNFNDLLNKSKLIMFDLENKSRQLEEDRQRNEESIEKLEKEEKNLLKEHNHITDESSLIRAHLDKLREEGSEAERSIEVIALDSRDEREEINSLESKITDLKVSNASFIEQQKNLRHLIIKLESDSKTREFESCKRKEEERKLELDILSLNSEFRALKQSSEELEDKQSFLLKALSETELKRQELALELDKKMRNLKEIEELVNKIEKSVSEIELREEKSNLRYEHLNKRLWDDYELTFPMAKRFEKQEIESSLVTEEVTLIKRQIKSLGNINLDSIEEYREVSERFQFMTKQIKDLSDAKHSLRDVIDDMDEKMKSQFIEYFEIIRKNFKEVFEKLFGGGRADVFLEDYEEILSSGIEVVAQPPGKKLQSLSLLSGGERALTAISLLFAIIKTKPTPFCILDEIEAALDEANVYRYAQYLREFSHSTQFIAITHRKGTMENVDSLYGVTMQEEGISKLVSIKLSEKDKVS